MRGAVLGLPRQRELGEGYVLRLMPAREALECRLEGERMARVHGDEALCANACLLAHVYWKDGYPLYRDGAEVLEKMTAGQVAEMARQWGEFDRECNPGPWEERAVDEAKKGWSTRLMSGCSGVCLRLSEFFRRRSGRRG